MRKRFIIGFAYFIFMQTICLWAVPVRHLYTVTVPARSAQVQQRDFALRSAFAQILVRISGDSSILKQADIQSALADPNQAVQEYRFQNIQRQGNNQLFLRVKFQPQTIQSLITKSGHTIWGADRPLLLIWLVVKQDKGLQLISADNNSNIPQLIHQLAISRGLPTLLPVLDLDELNQISPADVWHMQVNKIEAISRRYAANAVLILRLTDSDAENWEAQGQLLFNQQSLPVSQTGDSSQMVLTTLLNQVSDTLAKQYNSSLPQQTLQTLTIEVVNVHSVATYAAVMRYLRQLDNVKDVQVVSVSPNQVQFAVTIANGQQAFNQAISLDRDLTLLKASQAKQSMQGVLRYRWNH